MTRVREGIMESDMGVLLYFMCQWSIMPDLYQFIGDDRKFLEFLEIFGGMKIKVPSKAALKEAVRNVHIYKSVRKDHSYLNMERLASLYDITRPQVRRIYKHVKYSIELETRPIMKHLAALEKKEE